MTTTGGEPKAAFESPVYRHGRDLSLPAIGTALATVLALVFGVARGASAAVPWANTAFWISLGVGVALAAYTIWYARSTTWRLTVHVEPPIYVLRITGGPPMEVRGPFTVRRAYTSGRLARGVRVTTPILDVVRSNGQFLRFTQTLPERALVQALPDDWHRGLPGGDPEAIYELPEKTSITHLADKLGAGARGAVDEDHIEKFAALLNAPPRKKAKKKQKKASSEATEE